MTTRMRTWILLAGLSALFVAVGGLVGGTSGIILFLVIAVGFNFAMFWFSDRLALKMSRARPLEPGQAPDLVADVEDLAQRARIPVPRLYLIPSQQPNAFATGRSPKHSAVAVTEGLLALMPRDQVRGVLAHELAHIRNRDVLVTTIAAMIGAAISAVAHFLQFQWLFGGGDDDESPLGFVGTLAAVLIAPIAAMLLQFAVSRQREFLADATAAELLGTGRPLADALGTLQRGVEVLPMQVNPAASSLYIVNPLSGHGMSALFSTHPPIPSRIERLLAFDASARAVADVAWRRRKDSGPWAPNRRPWRPRRRRSTAGSTWRSPGRSSSCRSGSGRSTSIACIRTSGSSCRSSSRRSSTGTWFPAGTSSTRSPARGRRSCSRSSRAAMRSASTWRASTASSCA